MGLALLLAGCGVAPAPPTAPPPTPPTVTAPPSTTAAQGVRLFRDKGCVSCHTNDRVPGREGAHARFPGAPDLSDYRNDPAFLRRWLRAPQAVRPGTRMPALPLSDDDIESLIAFLNAPR